jgi:phytoene dehydrogenase-like protein
MLSKHLGEDIQKLIECEQILTPNSLFENTGAYKGSIYGLNQNSLLKIISRKSNKDNTNKGLYYVGGTVHPGGGIPLALVSAKNTANLIKNEFYNK